MEFVVLAKAVPRSDAVRFDPERLRLVREEVDLVLNPFDQRALRVALELRRPGETVTVVSVGPPAARRPLGEALAVGADRVLLASDPALAGSDTLASARTIAAAVRSVGFGLVVAGARSTDSDTGQVPAEVAALLGVPVLSEARAVRRDPDGPGLEVTVDTPTGWATYRRDGPAVVSVGEKAGKPLRPGPDAPPIDPARVEVRSLEALGVDPRGVGAAGSPTVVTRVLPAAPLRSPAVFAEGTVADRVAGAVRALARRLEAPRPTPLPFGPASPSRSPSAEVLVLANGDDGELDPSALDRIAEVRRALPGHWPSAVWIGRPPTEAATFRLGRAGALGGWHVPTTEPLPDAGGFARAAEALLAHRPEVSAVLFSSDPFGREVAGALAARRGLGLVGDATAVRLDAALGLSFTKPSFGGRTLAEITVRGRPALATVRPGAFAPPPDGSADGGFGWSSIARVSVRNEVRRVAVGAEGGDAAGLARREVLVAVGMGVGGPEGIARLRPVLDRWNAGLVATRRVVDAGWAPRQHQLGLTGRSFAPRLAVLLGVSGSPNHMVGWRRAGAVLAVDRNADAPVFREVDVGIVGPLEEVVPQLAEPLARALAPRVD